MPDKPRLVVVSQVLPFPRKAGQHQRVYYKLIALRDRFHVTFLTAADTRLHEDIRAKLLDICDDVILLPSRYMNNRSQLGHWMLGGVYAARRGLKRSNYVVGQVELTPARIERVLADHPFDLALFEYWHAYQTCEVFRAHGVLTTLDMHDVLWKSFERQMRLRQGIPGLWKRWAVKAYQREEEAAWEHFDSVIAISQGEADYARDVLGDDKPIFYAPMGTDMDKWPYSYAPQEPLRLAYYGGLATKHNQQDALRCYHGIMPHIWAEFPDAELWLIGSHPPEHIRDLAERDPRVTVTGFVEDVPALLASVRVILSPWEGTYGFRSRIIEMMAVGVPVVATPDTIYGMNLNDGQGIYLAETDEALAARALTFCRDSDAATIASRAARAHVENRYSYESTYGRLRDELAAYVVEHRQEQTS